MPYYNKNDIPKHLHCYTKNCSYCERTFYTSKPKTKYCCNTCRAYAFQKRNPSGKAENKPQTKTELKKEIDRLEREARQSVFFRSKKAYKRSFQQLNILRSHLLIAQPEKPTLQDDELINLLLQTVLGDESMIEKMLTTLNKDLKK
jgi:hypothetical protein